MNLLPFEDAEAGLPLLNLLLSFLHSLFIGWRAKLFLSEACLTLEPSLT